MVCILASGSSCPGLNSQSSQMFLRGKIWIFVYSLNYYPAVLTNCYSRRVTTWENNQDIENIKTDYLCDPIKYFTKSEKDESFYHDDS